MIKSMANHNQKGSILIGLIATMVIMGFLGAAMVSLTSTSSFKQVYGAMAQKAFHLAESGFRYAAMEYANVNDSENNGINENQNAKANELHGRTLSMAEGSIHLSVVPFHYATSAAANAGDTSLSVQFPGGSPAGFAIPSTGKIQILTQTRPNAATQYTSYPDTYDYTAFTVNSPSTGTFTLSTGLTRAVPRWQSVAVVGVPNANQTITPNPDPALTNNRLTLTKPATGFFMPLRNGKFKITGNPVVYLYAHRVDGTSTTTLYGVSNSLDPASSTAFSVTTTSNIIPNDFFSVASTGTVDGASRTLTFITPVDITGAASSADQKTTSADPFTAGVNPGTEGSNWWEAAAGAYSVDGTVTGGEKSGDTTGQAALRLTGSQQYGSTGCGGNDKYFSLIALKWGQNYANFPSARLARNKTLSYDAQVKMKLPQTNNYYMAGMLFRLNLVTDLNASSWLGVSFLRGRNGGSPDRDGIEDGIVPLDNTPMIVLWRKPAGQGIGGMQWIAYKVIANRINFDQGQNPKFVNGVNSYFIRGGNSGARADVTSVSTADTGVTGSLGFSRIYSAFEEGEQLFQLNLQGDVDARVQTPISSTSINYDRGTDSTTLRINVGDIIRGRNSNASARVTAITRERYNILMIWYYYRGTISITETEGNFSNNEWLDVYRPNASHSARFVVLDDLLSTGNSYVKQWSTLLLRIEEKLAASGDFSGQYVNDIKIYTGDIDNHGTPTGSPLDVPKYANKRWSNPLAPGDVQWPPDSGWSSQPLAPGKDHFTLVQEWTMNPALSSSFVLRPPTAEEPYSTIRTNTFTTHGMTAFTQQELGLTTAGPASMHNNTWFDDFGVQLEGGTTGGQTGFSTPLMY